MRKKLLVPLVLCVSLLFGACSNYIEIEELIIVAGAAIDYDEETGLYNVTAEIIDLQNSNGQDSPYETFYIESPGESLVEAITHMSRIAGRQLYWGHASVFILSRSVLTHSIEPVLDWFMRDLNARLSSMVVAADTEKANEIYKLKSPVQKSISLTLEEILENYRNAKGRTAVNVNELVNLYGIQGSAICMPIVSSEKNVDQDILVIHSYAVLKNDRLSGVYESDDIGYLMLLLKNPMQNVIHVDVPEYDAEVTMRMLDHSLALDATLKEGVVHTTVDVTLNVLIVGSRNGEAIKDLEGSRIVMEAAEETVASACRRVLDKDVQEFHADILSVGQHIKRHDPETWRLIEKDWEQYYAGMQYEVTANVIIDKSSEVSPINN